MADQNSNVRDSDWVRKTFMLSKNNVQGDFNKSWLTHTTANDKFTDTRLGGNFAINNPPQYTQFADIRRQTRLTNTFIGDATRMGMGRFYSEQIDDNSQLVTMQFGVPEYNGMLTFFTGFFDAYASTLANEGRGASDSIFYSVFYTAGKLLGLFAMIRAWPIILLIGVGNLMRFKARWPSSKYYYMKPAMGVYWNRVNLIANNIAVNMGLIPKVQIPWFHKSEPIVGVQGEFNDEGQTNEYINYFSQEAPDLFLPGGGIDVYNVATRAQRLALKKIDALQKLAGDENLNTKQEYFTRLNTFRREWGVDTKQSAKDISIQEYLAVYHGSPAYNQTEPIKDEKITVTSTATAPAGGGDIANVTAPASAAAPSDGKASVTKAASMRARFLKSTDASVVTADSLNADGGYMDDGKDARTEESFWTQLEAGEQGGDQFISFRVEGRDSVTESFSSSVGDSDIQSKFNSTSSNVRTTRFNFSEGNTGIPGVDQIVGAASSFMSGILDGVQISGLMSLAGSAFVDIPKVWKDSSASMPSSSYTIQLRSPYGNKFARFQNLYVPMAMLLAAALPISTGRQSYTSPFLCMVYSKGKNLIRLGMITELSFTRGVGNMPWNTEGEALAIDVSFTVTDMSSLMHAPIDSGKGSLLPWKGIFDDDNAFMDYIASLSSVSLQDMIYPTRIFELNLTRKKIAYQTFFSRSHFASVLTNSGPGRVISAFYRNPEISISR